MQGKRATHRTGDLSPLLGRQWAKQSGLQAKQQMQAKQQPVSPAAAFKGGGSPLPPALMAKYEQLAGGNVNLGDVRIHTGSSVDSILESNGLDGVTDRKNVAVRTGAAPKTLEHEIGHVLQGRLLKNFNLNEQTRADYETQADNFADKLAANQPIVTASAQSTIATISENKVDSFQGMKTQGLQSKCSECEDRAKKYKKSEALQNKEEESNYKSQSEGGGDIEDFMVCLNDEFASHGLSGHLLAILETICAAQSYVSNQNGEEPPLILGIPLMAICIASAIVTLSLLTITTVVGCLNSVFDGDGAAALSGSGPYEAEHQRIIDSVNECMERGGTPQTCAPPGIL